MISMLKTLLELVTGYGGYIGVFTISFVSNSVPFIGVPYLLLVANYIAWEAVGHGLPAEVALIVASALGSAIGKVLVYSVAAGFRLKLNEKTRENLKYFVNYSKRVAFPLIVLFAATPAPDDLLYVPLGIAKYPLPYYFLGVFFGKTLMVWLATTYFKLIYGYLSEEVTLNPLIAVLVAVITAYITATIIKMEWKKIGEAYSREGIISSTKVLLTEFFGTALGLAKRIFTKTKTMLRRPFAVREEKES